MSTATTSVIDGAVPSCPAWLARVGAAASSALRLAIGLTAAACVWEGLIVLFDISPYYLPRLSVIASAILASPEAYISGLLRTGAETLIGMVTGVLFGIAIGILFFRFPTLRDMIFPIFIVSQTIPVIAFGALVVLWFGNTLLAKAVIAFYLTFFPVTVNTLQGLASVDPRQVALMRSFGATDSQILRRLQLPSALPQIFVALRLAASLALVGAIVGEWFGDTTGLGVLLLQAMFNEHVVGIWAALLTSAFLGTTLYGAIAALERAIVFWGDEL